MKGIRPRTAEWLLTQGVGYDLEGPILLRVDFRCEGQVQRFPANVDAARERHADAATWPQGAFIRREGECRIAYEPELREQHHNPVERVATLRGATGDRAQQHAVAGSTGPQLANPPPFVRLPAQRLEGVVAHTLCDGTRRCEHLHHKQQASGQPQTTRDHPFRNRLRGD